MTVSERVLVPQEAHYEPHLKVSLGYLITIAFLGWEGIANTITAPDPIEWSVVWGPLVPFTLAAIAALLAPSRRWSVAVTMLIVWLLVVGACLSFMVVRGEYFIIP